jgi:pimeloyl-ACP methyl ester carboxylesterase
VDEAAAGELIVQVPGARLAVSHTPGPRATLVALHGASAGTRDHHLYRHLHAVVPTYGVGVATFDRRGEGASTGEPSVGDFKLQAADALAVADAVGAGRIGLWGFSQGAWVAPIAAGRTARVRFMVLVAATGVTPSVQMRYATAEQLRRSGYEAPVVQRALALRDQFERWIHDPDLAGGEVLQLMLARGQREPWWELAFLPAELPDERGRQAWIAEMDFDPVPYMETDDVPTLLFYGQDDAWSPVDASVEAWRKARSDVPEIRIIPGASHDLELRDGQLAPDYERQLVAWLMKLNGVRRGEGDRPGRRA